MNDKVLRIADGLHLEAPLLAIADIMFVYGQKYVCLLNSNILRGMYFTTGARLFDGTITC